MFDIEQYKKNKENRLKILEIHKISMALKTMPISSDEIDKVLNEQHFKEL